MWLEALACVHNLQYSSVQLYNIHVLLFSCSLYAISCKIWWPPKMGWGGVGIWVKLYPRVLFFGSSNASTAYPEKRGFSFSAPNYVFRWWVCSFGVGFPRGQCSAYFPFLPQNHFSMVLIRLLSSSSSSYLFLS